MLQSDESPILQIIDAPGKNSITLFLPQAKRQRSAECNCWEPECPLTHLGGT